MPTVSAPRATWLQMVSESTLYKQASGWNVSGITTVTDEISLGSHLPLSPSPKQILTVREGGSLMSCVVVTAAAVRLLPQHLYSPEAASQDVRNSCKSSGKTGPNRTCRAELVVWSVYNSSPTSVHTWRCDVSNHPNTRKSQPLQKGEETPELPVVGTWEPSKNGKGRKVAING